MNNQTPELKNQETSYDQNKMGHLNLLSDYDVHVMLGHYVQQKKR